MVRKNRARETNNWREIADLVSTPISRIAPLAVTCFLISGCGLRQSSDLSNTRRPSHQMEPVLESLPTPATPHASAPAAIKQVGLWTRAEGNSVLDYDVDRPILTITLPKVLREISDIAIISEHEIACVQDERGVVFVYDLRAKRITDEVHFASHGDYEGLALVNSQVYVLRSDGVLFHLSSMKHHPSVNKIDLELPFKESEGLCLDRNQTRLLIAPKSRPATEKGKGARPIYAFDLSTQKLAKSPAFELSDHEIRRFAKHHGLPIPRRPKKNGESMHNALHFMPSAIAVQPQTGEVFIVSAVDHVLVSCDERGNLTGYAVLDASLFRQPEGIAFLPNGDMLISNEAAGKEPTLVLLRSKHAIDSASGNGAESR